MVMVRIVGSSSDLHASDARYHKDCLSRFFSQRNAPGESKGTHDEEEEKTLQSTCLMQLTTEIRADRTKIWIRWGCKSDSQSLCVVQSS